MRNQIYSHTPEGKEENNNLLEIYQQRTKDTLIKQRLELIQNYINDNNIDEEKYTTDIKNIQIEMSKYKEGSDKYFRLEYKIIALNEARKTWESLNVKN